MNRPVVTDGLEPLRAEVRAWLRKAWSAEITVREWWRRLADARLSAPAWPAPWGRSLPPPAVAAVTRELAAAGVIAPPDGGVAMRLVGPTLLQHATPPQLTRYLPSMLRGEESWCQLFSEPGAGSDLPSLATRAVRDGDRFVVNGQKVWSSAADLARRGLLLARTDPGSAGRQGISCFIIDMDQPGVEVRPLRQMNGEANFCEVFLTDAIVAVDDLVGQLNRGWQVARTALAHERASAADQPARGLVAVPSGERAGMLDRRVGDVVAAATTRRRRLTGAALPAIRMFELARERGVASEPVMRQELVQYLILLEVHRLTLQRVRRAVAEGRAGAGTSLAKLSLSRICRYSRDLSFRILGAAATLSGGDAPYGGEIQRVGLASPGVSIGAGTDEIQRNTIAERVLGLPSELRNRPDQHDRT
jgi:alkylation response protein AidB-like acyl-CoA dehydrogenase